LLSCFVSRKALIGRAVKDGVRVFESEQVADFFDWYRAEIEAAARAKHGAGMPCFGEHDVLVLDHDLNRPARC